jgi:hypothetical protein
MERGSRRFGGLARAHDRLHERAVERQPVEDGEDLLTGRQVVAADRLADRAKQRALAAS